MSRKNMAPLIGRFKVLRRLGEGAMGEVFLAEMQGMGGFGRLMALKRIHPHLAHKQEFTDALIREATIGGRLNHPNIVQTIALQKHERTYYLLMEYVEGVTLRDVLYYSTTFGRSLPLALTLDILRQVCEGLAYAHMARDTDGQPLGTIHRDLKPDNVMLCASGVAKIADFGVARASALARLHYSVGGLKGTIAYMSPEQACCSPLDQRSDLYSLGALMFEMLTLERLYPEAEGVRGLMAVQKGNVQERLVLLEGIPPRLKQLVTRLLSREADERPTTALEVKRELLACMAVLSQPYYDLSPMVSHIRELQSGGRIAITDHSTFRQSPSLIPTVLNTHPGPSLTSPSLEA